MVIVTTLTLLIVPRSVEQSHALDVIQFAEAYVAKLTRCNLRNQSTTGLDLDNVIWRNPSY
jgi:hypothetical protein